MEQSSQFTKELDLVQCAKAIWKKWWLVALSAVLCAVIAFSGTYFFITPTYESSALIYVNNSSVSLGSASFSISASDLSAAQSLVDTYIVILESRNTLNDIIEQAHLDYEYEDLKKMIKAGSVNSTEVFEVVVTSTDPYEAERIANTIASVLPDKISDIVEGSSVKIVDYAVVAAKRAAPSYSQAALIGLLIGLVLSVGGIILVEMFDIYVRDEQYVINTYQLPILAAIPNMRVSEGSGYYKSNDYYSSSKVTLKQKQEEEDD